MSTPTLYSDNSKPKNFLEALQNAVLKRYTKSFTKEPIVYEFTQDRAMLHQYYNLRERMYQRMYNTDHSYEEDLHDKLSYILVARRGRLCLGGCRLTVREADEMWDLPSETSDFKLRNAISDLPLHRERHAEFSRMAVVEDCGDPNILLELSRLIRDKSIDLEVKYVFTKSTYRLARNWRLIGHKLGLKTKIFREIKIAPPLVSDEEWNISMFDLTEFYKKEALPPANEKTPNIISFSEDRPALTLVE